MKRRSVLLLIAANLVVLVTLAFAYPHLMVSPGALRPAHTQLATDCFACHSPWLGAAPQRCMQCHALADIGLRTTKGVSVAKQIVKRSFHQDLKEPDCIACHSDHPRPMLVERRHRTFSHALLRAEVRDDCGSCHTAPGNTLHANVTGTCGQCHQAERWKPATFDHGKHFALDHPHDATCTTCHVDAEFSRYTCYGCHEHTAANVRSQHLEEGIRNTENCVECHRSANEEPGAKGPRGGRDRD